MPVSCQEAVSGISSICKAMVASQLMIFLIRILYHSCTFGAMHTLGIEQGRDASGLSQAVEIQYLGAALPYVRFERITVTSMTLQYMPQGNDAGHRCYHHVRQGEDLEHPS